MTQPSTSKAGTNLDFEDIYSVDTDIEEDIGDSPNSAYTPLKSIFENKKFYVDNSFEEGVLTKLNKYIMAYKGYVFIILLPPDLQKLVKPLWFKILSILVTILSHNLNSVPIPR